MLNFIKNLFKPGPEFRDKDIVKVVSGFYAGQKAVVTDKVYGGYIINFDLNTQYRYMGSVTVSAKEITLVERKHND